MVRTYVRMCLDKRDVSFTAPGTPFTRHIALRKGLPQGFPMSPSVFTIVVGFYPLGVAGDVEGRRENMRRRLHADTRVCRPFVHRRRHQRETNPTYGAGVARLLGLGWHANATVRKRMIGSEAPQQGVAAQAGQSEHCAKRELFVYLRNHVGGQQKHRTHGHSAQSPQRCAWRAMRQLFCFPRETCILKPFRFFRVIVTSTAFHAGFIVSARMTVTGNNPTCFKCRVFDHAL